MDYMPIIVCLGFGVAVAVGYVASRVVRKAFRRVDDPLRVGHVMPVDEPPLEELRTQRERAMRVFGTRRGHLAQVWHEEGARSPSSTDEAFDLMEYLAAQEGEDDGPLDELPENDASDVSPDREVGDVDDDDDAPSPESSSSTDEDPDVTQHMAAIVRNEDENGPSPDSLTEDDDEGTDITRHIAARDGEDDPSPSEPSPEDTESQVG